MSPSVALAWLMWTRHRRSLTLYGIGILLAVLIRLLFTQASPEWHIATVFCLGVFAIVYLPVVFSFGLETRLEMCESGFPPRLWHLPMKTWALVGWPMLLGSLISCGIWLILAAGILRPIDLPVALWWPGLLLAVVLTWLQALIWLPFPLPWMRPLVLIPVLSCVSILPTVLSQRDVPETQLCVLLAILLVCAYGIALIGVSRARHGGVRRWERPTYALLLRHRADFALATRAQRWFEFRRCGYSFPLMVGFCSLAWLASLTTIAQFIEEAAQARLFFFPEALLQEFGSLLLTTGCLFLSPLFLSCMTGSELGKLPGRERSENISSFLATRPVSTALLVRAKYEAAALATLAGWGVLAVGFLLWLPLGGKAHEIMEQFTALRQRHSAGPFWTALALFLIGAVALSWLNTIAGLWLGLVGRSRKTVIVVVFSVAGTGSFAFAQWLASTPERWQHFSDLLPWLAVGALVLKALAACWSLRILGRSQLISRRYLIGALGGWVILAASLFLVLAWLLPRSSISLSSIVLGLVLLLPLTRLALAPLALDWNRHR